VSISQVSRAWQIRQSQVSVDMTNSFDVSIVTEWHSSLLVDFCQRTVLCPHRKLVSCFLSW
jgi:hypothetical protein